MALQTIGLGGVLTFDNAQAVQAMGQARDSLGRFTAGVNQVNPALNSVSQAATATAAKIKASFAGLQQGVTNAVGAIRNAAVGMLPMTVTVGVGAKAAVDFERQMSIVAAASGASATEFDMLQKKAKEMGVTSVFSATQAGEAMEAMAKAGATTTEILSGLGGVMNAAAADAIPLGTAADIVSQIVKGMGMQFSDASHIADVLAYTAAATNTDIIGLGESFKYGAGQAYAMGIPLEETAAIMGKLADAGQRGSLGGTTFSNMLMKLADPSEKAAGWMKQWGIRLTDTTGKMRKITDIVADFQAQIGRVPDKAQQASMATEIFGQRGARAYTALAAAGRDATNALEQALINSSEGLGYATETAQKKLDNFAGAMRLFMSSMESLGIGVFGPMLRPFADTVRGMTDGLNNVLMSLQGVQDVQSNLALETAKSGEALGAFGTEQAKVIGLSKSQEIVAKKYMTAMGSLMMINRELTAAEKERYNYAQQRLTEIMGKEKLKGGVTSQMALQAIQAQMRVNAEQLKANDLIRIQLFEREKMEEIEKKYGKTAVTIAQGIQDAIVWVNEAWQTVVDTVRRLGDTIKEKIGEDKLRKIVKIATLFVLIAAAAAPVVLAIIAMSWTIGQLVSSVLALKGVFLGAVAAIKGVFIAIVGAAWPLWIVIGAIAIAFMAFRKNGESVGDTIWRAFDLAKQGVLALWNDVLKPLWNWFDTNLIPIFKRMGDSFINALDIMGDAFKRTFGVLGGIVMDAYNTALKPLVDWASKAVPQALDTLSQMWDDFWNRLASEASAWLDLLTGIFKDLYDRALKPLLGFFAQEMPGIVEASGGVFVEFWNGATQAASDGMANLRGIFNDMYQNSIIPFIEGMKDAFLPVWETLKETWVGIWGVIKETFAETWTMIKSTMAEIAAEFTGTTTGAEINWRELGQTVVSILGAIAMAVVQVVGFVINTFMQLVQILLPVLKVPFTTMIGFFKLFVSAFQDILNGNFMEGLKKIGVAIFDMLTMPFRMALRLIIALASKIPGAEKLMGGEFMKSAKQFAEGGLTSFTYPIKKGEVTPIVATRATAALEGARPTVPGTVPGTTTPDTKALKDQVTAMTDLKAQMAKKEKITLDNKVTVEDKRTLNVNSTVNVDGERMAQSVARHKQEISDRAGFKSMPWARRMSAEQGASVVRGGGGVT